MTPADLRDLLARAASVIREGDHDDEHAEILEELRQAREEIQHDAAAGEGR